MYLSALSSPHQAHVLLGQLKTAAVLIAGALLFDARLTLSLTLILALTLTLTLTLP